MARCAPTPSSETTLGRTSFSYTRRPSPRAGDVRGARARAPRRTRARGPRRRVACELRSRARRTACTGRVSIPEISSKNQPQLVYMSMRVALPSPAAGARARARSARAARAACAGEELARASRRSRIEQHLDVARRARPTGRAKSARRDSPRTARRARSRSQSSASRSGARHAWFQPGSAAGAAAAVVAPALDAVRAAPRRCPRAISTSHVAGTLRAELGRSSSSRGRSARLDAARAPTRAPCRRSGDGGRRSRRRSRCGTASGPSRLGSNRAPVSRRDESLAVGESSRSKATACAIVAVVEEEVDRSRPTAARHGTAASDRTRSGRVPPLAARRRHARAWCGASTVNADALLARAPRARRVGRASRGATCPRARGRSGAGSRAMPQRTCVAPIARRRERQDHVVVAPAPSRSRGREPLGARAIGLEHARVDVGRAARSSHDEQRRAEVEADALVVVDDLDDAVRRRRRRAPRAFGA